MSTPQLPVLRPKAVLGVAAHPDDLDFGAAGTLAKFAAEGAEVHYLILTDGSKGSTDYHASPGKLTKMRRAEQQAAVKAIGGTKAHFLNHPDGELEVTMALKREIVRTIRELKPEVVITMDPSMLYSAERGFINHPDHRAAGQATLDAVFPLARDHLSFPELFAEGYEPHKVRTVLLVNFDKNNFHVDISDFIDKKWTALQAHTSQMADFNAVKNLMEGYAKEAGKAAGCRYAESFVRIDVH